MRSAESPSLRSRTYRLSISAFLRSPTIRDALPGDRPHTYILVHTLEWIKSRIISISESLTAGAKRNLPPSRQSLASHPSRSRAPGAGAGGCGSPPPRSPRGPARPEVWAGPSGTPGKGSLVLGQEAPSPATPSTALPIASQACFTHSAGSGSFRSAKPGLGDLDRVPGHLPALLSHLPGLYPTTHTLSLPSSSLPESPLPQFPLLPSPTSLPPAQELSRQNFPGQIPLYSSRLCLNIS